MHFSRGALKLCTALLLSLATQAVAASLSLGSAAIYTYTDDAGILTFTNELHSIPEKYRDKLVAREADAPQTAAPASASIPAPADGRPAIPAKVRKVTASAEYRMGAHDTRADALRLAVEAAKKEALEQVSTYLESVTEVRDMDVTREDIRTYTAGIVNILNQSITTRMEQGSTIVRADLTAEIDPHEVAQAITALRDNESARQELAALRAETDQLQQQLDAANQSLAAATSPEEVQTLTQRRRDMFDELQANALVSQAWTSWTYPTMGFYSYPGIVVGGVNGLLLQAQRLSPRHRHLALAQRMITMQNGTVSPDMAPLSKQTLRQSSVTPPLPPVSSYIPPLLTPAGVPAKVGDIVNLQAQGSAPPATYQPSPQPPPYQLHPSHFWRPSPPNIRTSPSLSQQSPSVGPRSGGGPIAGASGGHSFSHGAGRGR